MTLAEFERVSQAFDGARHLLQERAHRKAGGRVAGQEAQAV